MDVKGIGIDIVDIKKLEKILKGKAGKAFIKNTFTNHEIACAKGGINIYKLATSFAAKEAVYKAFGTGWIEGKDVEVLRTKEEGTPSIRLHGEIEKMAKKRKIRKVLVSLSFTESNAIAMAVLVS
ncbi:MAG: holo-ACP synthase [Candidatus Micrarchaeota archaeon]|nr:holo-ACP synthase [Candidatus Micrarchaeota archaeon]